MQSTILKIKVSVFRTIMSSYPQISVCVVKSQTIIIKKPLRLSSGLVINEQTIGFESCGTLNDSATNAIKVCHAASAYDDAARWYNVVKIRGGGIIT